MQTRRERNAYWDQRHMAVALEVAKNSKCLSRQIGAVLVRDNVIVATGYNGPPRGVPHCGDGMAEPACPRRLLKYKSGEALHLCPAAHAEANCIANAARVGVQTTGTTMYAACEIPCKNCLALLINAGVSEVVCLSTAHYDKLSEFILKNARITVRMIDQPV